jgi:hypothetical protein
VALEVAVDHHQVPIASFELGSLLGLEDLPEPPGGQWVEAGELLADPCLAGGDGCADLLDLAV